MKREDILKVLEEANGVSSNLSDKQIEQYTSESHKKQVRDRASKGGKVKSDKKTEHLNKLSKTYSHIQGKRNVESGHLSSIQSKGGKAGAKSQIEKGLGIHTDSETRREWARLGGLKTVAKLNIEKTCPYCGIITRGAAYNRWHGDKCKHKII
jgi:hypothetical protein